MALKPSPPIDVFRATLQRVEEESGLAPDDPSLLELKRILLKRIAELELTRTEISAAPNDASGSLAPTVDPALEPVVESEDVTPLLAQADPELPNSSLTAAVPDKLR